MREEGIRGPGLIKAERRQYVKRGEVSAVLGGYLKLGQKMHTGIGSLERVGDLDKSTLNRVAGMHNKTGKGKRQWEVRK